MADQPTRPPSRAPTPADDGTAEDVQVGEKAKWLTPKDKGSCTLMILDQNAVLLPEYKPADKPAPRSQ